VSSCFRTEKESLEQTLVEEKAVAPDCGFYTTAGLTLYSDTRGGNPGGPVQRNRVLHNRSRVTGTWEGQPAADGFEITDGGLITESPLIDKRRGRMAPPPL